MSEAVILKFEKKRFSPPEYFVQCAVCGDTFSTEIFVDRDKTPGKDYCSQTCWDRDKVE